MQQFNICSLASIRISTSQSTQQMFIHHKMYFVLDFATQYIMCVRLFSFLFASLLFSVLEFVWYFVGQNLRDIFVRCTAKQPNQRERKHRFKMHTQLKCGESFSTIHSNTHTHFLNGTFVARFFFTVAPYQFNGNYNLIASFNIIIGHRQHVNGISIIYATYRILCENKKKGEKKTVELKCKLRLFGILMGWQCQSKSLSLCWNWRWRQHHRSGICILSSTTNF